MLTNPTDTDTSWKKKAACAGLDVDLFYPGPGMTSTEAYRVCKTCPVQEQCLKFSLTNHEEFGVWGNLSAKGRELLHSRQRKAA
jgi:WhiB family transcriptional regulator, redox-sensing transcriptional regulator